MSPICIAFIILPMLWIQSPSSPQMICLHRDPSAPTWFSSLNTERGLPRRVSPGLLRRAAGSQNKSLWNGRTLAKLKSRSVAPLPPAVYFWHDFNGATWIYQPFKDKELAEKAAYEIQKRNWDSTIPTGTLMAINKNRVAKGRTKLRRSRSENPRPISSFFQCGYPFCHWFRT